MSIKPTYEELERRIRVLEQAETKRKKVEKALQEREKRYRGTLDNMMEGCQIIGYDWRYLYVNSAVARHAHLAKTELLGRRIMDVFPGIEQTEVFIYLRRCMEKRIPKKLENKFIYPDGSTSWFELSIEPVPEGIFVLSFDITNRKLTEAALIESEKRLNEAQSIAGMGDFTWDVGNGKVTWSEGLVELLKYDKNEEIDYDKVNAEIHHPDDLERVTRWLKDGIASGEEKLTPNEYRIFDREGNTMWVRTVGRIEREDGKQVRIFATLQDITDRKHSEEVQERLRSQLTQSQKMESIGRLAGGVAHDLNNLLSPIIGFGEMLLEDLEPDDPKRNHVDQILNAGLRSRDLVRQLLAFSRKQTLSFKPLNLNNTVQGFKKLLRRTIPEDIEMELLLAPVMKPVMADIGQIEQVIMNLAINAADAMPEGGKLTIETDLTDLDEAYSAIHTEVLPGRYVMLAISDTGNGMDEETRQRIFEPFFSTKGERGTGLGLATVYGIVKQHGGNIWIYSEKEKGTTFKVYLPVTEPARSEENTRSTEIENLKGSETILLVEDNEEVLQLARTILSRLGYQVLAFNEPAETLAALDSSPIPIDLLLTDVVMPGMNGRELYEKCVKKIPRLKVIYMSGYTDNVIAHRGVLDQGINFIQKPFSLQALALKVREVLEQE